MQLEAQRKDCTSSVQIRDCWLDSPLLPSLLQIWCNFFRHCYVVCREKCNVLRIAACGMHFLLEEYSFLVFEGQAFNHSSHC